jgi:hypothetical protein
MFLSAQGRYPNLLCAKQRFAQRFVWRQRAAQGLTSGGGTHAILDWLAKWSS